MNRKYRIPVGALLRKILPDLINVAGLGETMIRLRHLG